MHRDAFAIAATRRLVIGDMRLAPYPILAEPCEDTDGIDASALRAGGVLGVPADYTGKLRLTVPESAATWLAQPWAGILRASSVLRRAATSWRVNGREIDLLRRPLVMGIVNVTPDSFSDGGQFYANGDGVAHALELVSRGADILDIGGESTRPGADPVAPAEEIRRTVPVIRELAGQVEVPISIDTRRAAVAEAALEAGASIVNDVSALEDDPRMVDVIRESNAGVVLMHKRGQPADMQDNTDYEDLFGEVIAVLERSLTLAYDAGIDLRRTLVDPGIGFGKRLEQNLALIAGLDRFWALGRPTLLGPSRKRFLGELTGRPVTERVHATVASVSLGVAAGASVIRAHDVRAVVDGVRVAHAIATALPGP